MAQVLRLRKLLTSMTEIGYMKPKYNLLSYGKLHHILFTHRLSQYSKKIVKTGKKEGIICEEGSKTDKNGNSALKNQAAFHVKSKKGSSLKSSVLSESKKNDPSEFNEASSVGIIPVKEVLNNIKKSKFTEEKNVETQISTPLTPEKCSKASVSKRKIFLIKNKTHKVYYQSQSSIHKNEKSSKFVCEESDQQNSVSSENIESEISREKDSDYKKNNILGIQTLSPGLSEQIFKKVLPKDSQETEEDLQRSKEHLEAHGLWGKTPSLLQDVDLQLPLLEGETLDDHFRTIAEDQCGPYKMLLGELVGANMPSLPRKWEYTVGWTRYNADGSCTPVECPDSRALVLDVEVCVREGSHPTLATAVSSNHWYSWCSEQLIHDQDIDQIGLKHLIPIESSASTAGQSRQPHIIVGHNVGYDRIRIQDHFCMEDTPLRFLDTMSLHIAVSGLVSEQRAMLMKLKNNNSNMKLPWMLVGCKNNLNDVYRFYTKSNENLNKSTRDTFVKGNLADVRDDFQNLMNYCANDVKATHAVIVKLLPLFFERFPHPVTFSGMLEMGTTFLPVTQNWEKYIEAAEAEYHRVQNQMVTELVKQAKDALSLMENKQYEEDPWLWSLDWALPTARVRKLVGYPNWYRKLCTQTGEREGTPKPENMSTGLQVVPKLLRLTWDGFPLHYVRKYGWGYLKPLYNSVDDIPESEMSSHGSDNEDDVVFPFKAFYDLCARRTSDKKETEATVVRDEEILSGEFGENSATKKNKNGGPKENLKNIGIPGVRFVPLPHKNGPESRVGNPLARDYLTKIEDKTLSSHYGDIAELVLRTSKSLSYWKNNRDRILSQMVVWLHDLPASVQSAASYSEGGKYGVILPGVVTAGTITRRAVDPTWMTASNAYPDRIGSELKAMIEAPPGHKFVGADVDSQELWIAALLGDAYFSGEHGATALGWMTLQGKKSDGTDMHSHTAKNAGISRDHAKIINYGRIYGAGLRFIQRLMKQFNPLLSEAETKKRAENLYASTKGERKWYLNNLGEDLTNDVKFCFKGEPMTKQQIRNLIGKCREHGIEVSFDAITENPPIWAGGSESHMFNCLEAIARSQTPRTPVLGGRITRALEPQYVDDQFITSRVNWVVQSSAVDYLHIMLVCMRWLLTKYSISGRFCISIHDEVRYLVSSEDCYRAALALQITNLLTRSYFALKLGFRDLPQSVAFFSGVDIDTVLRKEPHLDCVTPSNPEGMLKGYGVPYGQTLDIHEIIKITNGKLSKEDNKLSNVMSVCTEE